MVYSIEENYNDIKVYGGFNYEQGLREIEYAREGLKRRNVEQRVIDDLDSIKDFWSSNNFYTKSEDCIPLLILEKALSYFEDARRIKYVDCEKRVQELFDKLREYFIEDADIKLIKEKYDRENYNREKYKYVHCDEQESETITAGELFDKIDYAIKEMELLDKYTGSNHEKEISMYKFVKDTVIKFGISDSYVAQVLYKRIYNSFDRRNEARNDMPRMVLMLEMYRCVVKQSTATKDEMLAKFNLEK